MEVLYVDGGSVGVKSASVGVTVAVAVTLATSLTTATRDEDDEVAGIVNGKGKLLGR